MVDISFDPAFSKQISKISDSLLKERILKQIGKIRADPEVGKPMMHTRKGTREVRIPPFRLSYVYSRQLDSVEILEIYHKNEQ